MGDSMEENSNARRVRSESIGLLSDEDGLGTESKRGNLESIELSEFDGDQAGNSGVNGSESYGNTNNRQGFVPAGPAPAGPEGLLAKQLLTIKILWFLQGLSNAFVGAAQSVFLIKAARVSPSAQATLGVFIGLAWSLKLPVAFLSDTKPICGLRRKPYLYGGIALYAASYAVLAACRPSIPVIAMCLFFAALGQMMTGVMADTLVVENMRHETTAARGTLQTQCWILLTVGSVLGTLCGAAALQLGFSYSVVFWVNSSLRLALIPLICRLRDTPISASPMPHAVAPARKRKRSYLSVSENEDSTTTDKKGQGTREPSRRPPGRAEDGSGNASSQATPGQKSASEKAREMWKAAQRNQIWKPSLFIFFFSAFPSAGAVLPSFYVQQLRFTALDLAFLMVVGGLAGAVAMYLYNRFFKRIHWHTFFAWVVVAASALSASLLVLIFHLNRRAGIPDLAFAIGDDIVVDIALTLLAMPLLILIASLCPEGVESSVYAMVTSVQLAGTMVSKGASTVLIKALGITLDDMRNLWKLILICATVRLSVLPFIPLLPSSIGAGRGEASGSGEPNRQRSSASKSSWWGGVSLVTLLIGGVIWALSSAIANVVIESNH